MLPDGSRGSAAHHLQGGGRRLLLDCGPGTLHALARFGVPWAETDALALTHFHTDHVGDVPALFFALKHGVRPPRTRPLHVLGPPGLRRRFEHLAAAFGDHLLDPGFDLILVEVTGKGRWTHPGGGSTLSWHPTPHTEESVAYRWEGEGRAVGYTGDTGPSDEVAAFLSGCDLVVAECAYTDPPPEGNHLSPASLAAMARIMDPRLLVVTHVYPGQSPDEAARRVGEKGWSGRVAAARDGTVVRLVGDDPALAHPGTTA